MLLVPIALPYISESEVLPTGLAVHALAWLAWTQAVAVAHFQLRWQAGETFPYQDT